jgi:hypothetical protein
MLAGAMSNLAKFRRTRFKPSAFRSLNLTSATAAPSQDPGLVVFSMSQSLRTAATLGYSFVAGTATPLINLMIMFYEAPSDFFLLWPGRGAARQRCPARTKIARLLIFSAK